MSRFKICPKCGTKNSPDAIECENCEQDLMSVPVTDEQQEATKKFSDNKPEVQSSLIRICSECGKENPPNARKCSNCGEDISDVIPTTANAPTLELEIKLFVLRSLDDKITFNVDRDNIILGREHELKDYLAVKTFVSRRHCQLTLENGELFIEDLNSANGTYVDNQKIFQKTKLSKGNEVGLGGTVFNGSRQDNAAYFLVG